MKTIFHNPSKCYCSLFVIRLLLLTTIGILPVVIFSTAGAQTYYPATHILLRTTLYGTDATGARIYLADGVLNEFDSSYRDTLNRSQDISKLFSFNEKVAIWNYNTYLSIERSPLAEPGDTIHLSVTSLKQGQPYQFVLQTTNFTRP